MTKKKPIQTLTDLLDQDDYTWLDCDQIDANPDQDRLDWESDEAREKYETLMSSIRHDGKVKRPIEVYPTPEGRYVIIAGERRWRISVEIGFAKIPALIRKDITPQQASIDMLTENELHSPLSIIERALAFQKRIDNFGLTVSELSEIIGITPRRLHECTSVLKLDKALLDTVKKTFTRDLTLVLRLGRLKKKDEAAYQQGLALLAKRELTRESLKALSAKKTPVASTAKITPSKTNAKAKRPSTWTMELESQAAHSLYCKAMGSSACDVDPNSEEFKTIFLNFVKRLLDEK